MYLFKQTQDVLFHAYFILYHVTGLLEYEYKLQIIEICQGKKTKQKQNSCKLDSHCKDFEKSKDLKLFLYERKAVKDSLLKDGPCIKIWVKSVCFISTSF